MHSDSSELLHALIGIKEHIVEHERAQSKTVFSLIPLRDVQLSVSVFHTRSPAYDSFICFV